MGEGRSEPDFLHASAGREAEAGAEGDVGAFNFSAESVSLTHEP